MPLPKPKPDENQSTFISRCMSTLSDEFPQQSQRAAVCHRQWRERKDDDALNSAESAADKRDGGQTMALMHNSKVAEREPGWGTVDKTKLPRGAHARMGDAGKKSSWGFPHHWVKGGGDPNDDGVFTSGEMYLHKGGLNAAYATARGARAGQRAEAGVVSHLNVHRKALGLKEAEIEIPVKVTVSVEHEPELEPVEPEPEAAPEAKPDEPTAPPAEEPKALRTVDKQGVYHVDTPDAKIELKADDGTPHGSIAGYLSQFDVVDRQGDIVRRGAFAKTLAELKSGNRTLPLMCSHWARGGDLRDAVGHFTELEEDSYGLRFKAEFHGDQTSQQIREKLKTLREAGVFVGASIGYRPIQWKQIEIDGKPRIELSELALVEGTVTLKPANTGAVITDLKEAGMVGTAPAVTQINAIVESLAFEASDASAKDRVLAEKFGTREVAMEVGKQIVCLRDRIGSLTEPEPHDTEAEAGGSKDAPTEDEAVKHSPEEQTSEERENIIRQLEIARLSMED